MAPNPFKPYVRSPPYKKRRYSKASKKQYKSAVGADLEAFGKALTAKGRFEKSLQALPVHVRLHMYGFHPSRKPMANPYLKKKSKPYKRLTLG